MKRWAWEFVYIVVILSAIGGIIFVAIRDDQKQKKSADVSRFVIMSHGTIPHNSDSPIQYEILCDTVSGDQYLWIVDNFGGLARMDTKCQGTLSPAGYGGNVDIFGK